MASFIFPAFKYNLGKQWVDWNSEINIWLTPKLRLADGFPGYEKKYSMAFNGIDCKFYEDKVPSWHKIGKINGFNIDSVNQVTNEESDATYEEMESYPASAYVFSDECPVECWVKKDYEYQSVTTSHYNTEEAQNNGKYLDTKYWQTNYDFQEYYDPTEFAYYNIKEHPLNEDLVRISAFNNDIKPASAFSDFSKYEGEGCVITWSIVNKDHSILYNPICYFEFTKKHGSAIGKMNIDWNGECFNLK